MDKAPKLAQKIIDLEARVRQLEIAAFILNLILAIFFFAR
jgi:hypothetical protein